MTNALAVGLGGFLGALLRYGLTTWAHHRWSVGFPVGTLLVNVLGCFAIGVLMVPLEAGELGSLRVRAFVVIGCLGSFTTFSAFGHETVELLRHGAWRRATAYAAGSVVVGVLAVLAGRALGTGLWRGWG